MALNRRQPVVAQMLDVVGDHTINRSSWNSSPGNASYGSIGDEPPISSGVAMTGGETVSDSAGLVHHDVLARQSDNDALSQWCQGLEVELVQTSTRTLGVFSGVFSPVALSMFSALLFLRLGFVLGQAGLIQTLVQFLLAYMIIYMTILSICAISTNGAIEGGGAYFMISRALGPEFGGSIGLLFFCAQVVSSALYVSGFVEALLDNFGEHGSLVAEGSGLPLGTEYTTRWWNYLYCTLVLALCLLISLVGGSMFGKTSIFTLSVVVVCTLSVIISMLIKGGQCVMYPSSNSRHANVLGNDSLAFYPNCSNSTAKYTSWSTATFRENIHANYTVDYVTGQVMSFATVFSVLFSSVTGIMNGANMSGELKNPANSIPKGTLAAATFTLCTYIILSLLSCATAGRDLLVGNYTFMQAVNFWPPFIVIGIFAATLSAALANLIGGSRILHAVAKDEIFWILLKPATITSRGGNPYMAVLISWFLVQLVLLTGSLNSIAPMCSALFLLSYASTNLACLALDLTSAPNFRPTFRYFSSHTAFLGMIGSLAMCFLINAIYASISIAVLILLVVALHLRSFQTSWGSISQALIFHQVRKYLLLLDSRKDHIKFWRPQILLLVANPRANCPLIDFVNDLKKTGLYVLGHVHIGSMDDSNSPDPIQAKYPHWLGLIDFLKVKAFVELTLGDNIRDGVRHLIRMSGLGGMKPNTVCLGFYDNATPVDTLSRCRVKSSRNRLMNLRTDDTAVADPELSNLNSCFPELRSRADEKTLSGVDYVGLICDALRMNKNVCLLRHFGMFSKQSVLSTSRDRPVYIDVWPVDFFVPPASLASSQFDSTCLFVLQLACVLHMVSGWKQHTKLRIFACVRLGSSPSEAEMKKRRLTDYLTALRIRGKVHIVHYEDWSTDDQLHEACESNFLAPDCELPSIEQVRKMNGLIHEQCSRTAVVFLYLPRPPVHHGQQSRYLQCLETMTDDLPPTVLVHGLHPVTSTTL